MDVERPLLIDQQGASIRPPEDGLRHWYAGRRVFVSSLIDDLRVEPAAVREAIESVGAEAVMFESDLGAQDVAAEQAYLAGVASSEISSASSGRGMASASPPVIRPPTPNSWRPSSAVFASPSSSATVISTGRRATS